MANIDLYDLGLRADLNMLLRTPLSRRRLLALGAASVAATLTGCGLRGPGGRGGPPQGDASPTKTSADGACATPPGETAGPYPADGSNASGQTLNVLAKSGIVRANLTASLDGARIAAGVPATFKIKLVNVNDNCKPLSGYALYAWQCDREGQYSLYSSGATDVDYCRGVQASDANGDLSFQSIFPACYPGRWPHVHFEVFKSLDQANTSANALLTSQFAFPEDVCKTVYAGADGYSASVGNLGQLTLASDNVFGDTGGTSQLAATTGDLSTGYTSTFVIGVAV
jgi:protocatechuate 3,4-dioxygenase beta subunit